MVELCGDYQETKAKYKSQTFERNFRKQENDIVQKFYWYFPNMNLCQDELRYRYFMSIWSILFVKSTEGNEEPFEMNHLNYT